MMGWKTTERSIVRSQVPQPNDSRSIDKAITGPPAGVWGGTTWHRHLSRCSDQQGVLRVTFWRQCNKWPALARQPLRRGACACFAGSAGRGWAPPCQPCLPSHKSLHQPPGVPACCNIKTKTRLAIRHVSKYLKIPPFKYLSSNCLWLQVMISYLGSEWHISGKVSHSSSLSQHPQSCKGEDIKLYRNTKDKDRY